MASMRQTTVSGATLEPTFTNGGSPGFGAEKKVPGVGLLISRSGLVGGGGAAGCSTLWAGALARAETALAGKTLDGAWAWKAPRRKRKRWFPSRSSISHK